MTQAVIVDARNILDPEQTRGLGFVYLCTGRQVAAAAFEPVA
jgi:hypothetical protein